MSKVYIATSLTNADRAALVAKVLEECGHTITYPWWAHGAAGHAGMARLAEVAEAELTGVMAADVVVVLLPGGRGTHFEMGAAIAAGTPVLLWSEYGADFEVTNAACAFHFLHAVQREYGDLGDRHTCLALVGFVARLAVLAVGVDQHA